MNAVDVIVPCYNYGRYLRQCVDSILQETDVQARVLVIDDCSQDDTETIGRELARTDSRVEFRRHEKNRGHIATYNEGIEWASAPFLVLLSADDLLTRGSLGRSLAVLGHEPQVGMVFGRAIRFRSPSDVTDIPGVAECAYSVISGQRFIDRISDFPPNPVETPTVVVRTALQKQVGGYDPRLPHTGDLEMWLRFAMVASLAQLDAPQAYRRLHDANMHKQYIAGVLNDYTELKATFEVFCERCHPATGRSAYLQRVYRGVAMEAFWSAVRAFEQGDDRACDALAELAGSLYPAIRAERCWSRLSFKRRIGRRASRLLTAISSALRSGINNSQAGLSGDLKRVRVSA